MTKHKIQNNTKVQIPNNKIFILTFVIGILNLFCALNFDICHSYVYAQDNNKLVTLTKQIIEAKSNDELYTAFEELTDLYFQEDKFNEYVEFLQSLVKQKKTLEPVVNYHIGLMRYYQLKYLEEAQNWDEYFSQGNAYRDQIQESLQKTINSVMATDKLGIYARLILWKFHRDQMDSLHESALSDLMLATSEYAKDAKSLLPLKDIAGELVSYGEKARAREIYKVYVGKLLTFEIKDEELNKIASDFYREGNLDLSESIYDVYIERISQATSKEKLIPILIDIAKAFSYSATGGKDEGAKDEVYAEKIFKKIEEIGGKDAFGEELIYLRALNLEKSKEYLKAKDYYIDLVQRYAQTIHADEADFKAAIIYTYVATDIKTGRAYFEKLAQKEIPSPQAISSLYQLGLLSQWEEDFTLAKEYYNKLLEKAGDNFAETVTLTQERLKEIAEARPMEYNLKTFLDASLKEEYAMLDMTKLDLRSHPPKAKKDEDINIGSTPYTVESGCMQVELEYLWSGHIGNSRPKNEQASFVTQYTHSGTKEINLVVISPTGIIDRNIDLVDVY